MPRKDSETVQVGLRMKEPLRATLEAAADRRGVSLNNEMVRRLEASLNEEDRFGGPELMPIVNIMLGAFLRGGRIAARAAKHPDWTEADWLNDPQCYRIAAGMVHDALLAAEPERSEEFYKRYKVAGAEAGD
jgi:hypothetical protein